MVSDSNRSRSRHESHHGVAGPGLWKGERPSGGTDSASLSEKREELFRGAQWISMFHLESSTLPPGWATASSKQRTSVGTSDKLPFTAGALRHSQPASSKFMVNSSSYWFGGRPGIQRASSRSSEASIPKHLVFVFCSENREVGRDGEDNLSAVRLGSRVKKADLYQFESGRRRRAGHVRRSGMPLQISRDPHGKRTKRAGSRPGERRPILLHSAKSWHNCMCGIGLRERETQSGSARPSWPSRRKSRRRRVRWARRFQYRR